MLKTSSSLRERRTAWQFPGWFSKISLSWTISLISYSPPTPLVTQRMTGSTLYKLWIYIFVFSSLDCKISKRWLLWSNLYFTFHWFSHQPRFYNIRFICNYQMQWYVCNSLISNPSLSWVFQPYHLIKNVSELSLLQFKPTIVNKNKLTGL